MVSLQQADYMSSPARISFSTDLLDEDDFISINPDRGSVEDELCKKNISPIKTNKAVAVSVAVGAAGGGDERAATCSRRNVEFEFLSNNNNGQNKMVSADELFSDGKLLPYWKIQQMERLSIQTNKEQPQQQSRAAAAASASAVSDGPYGGRVSWFMDDDPSPRPPKCTVLWKELLRLKKNKPHSSSHLSPSLSSTSSSSNSSTSSNMDNEMKKKESCNNLKSRVKRGLERTTSATIRIRPMVNVPVVVVKGSLPPLFPLKNKGRS